MIRELWLEKERGTVKAPKTETDEYNKNRYDRDE